MYTILSIIKTFIFSVLVVSLSTPLYLLTFALLALKTIYTLVFNTFQIGVKSIAFLCNRIDNAIESLTVYLFNQKYIFLLALPAKILHLAANIIFIPVFTISKALDRLPSLIEYPHLVYFIHNIARDFFHNNDQKKFVESYLTFRSVNDIETFLDTKIIDDNSIDDDVDINEQFLILGLDAQSADQKEVNKAYRKLSLKNHPDKGGDPETQKKINEAKEYLDNFFSSNTESSNETTESRDLNLNQYFLYAMSLLIKIDQFNIFLEKNFRSLLSSLQVHKQRFNTNSLHNKINHWKETFKNKTSSFFKYCEDIIPSFLISIILVIEQTLMECFIPSYLWFNVYMPILTFILLFGFAAKINDYFFERKIHIGEIMTVISVMPIISFIILSSFISKLGELIFEILAVPLTALDLIYKFFVPSSSEDSLPSSFISKLGELIFEILAVPLKALNLIYNFFIPSIRIKRQLDIIESKQDNLASLVSHSDIDEIESSPPLISGPKPLNSRQLACETKDSSSNRAEIVRISLMSRPNRMNNLHPAYRTNPNTSLPMKN